MADDVRYEREGKVGVITLDRPPRNAYTTRMHIALEEAWVEAAADREAAVILTRAEGDHFCAGAEMTGDEGEDRPHRLEAWDFYSFIRDVPKPTIAAVQGGCIGGGLRFVWPCDLIVAAEDAFFMDPTVRFGLGGIQSHGHTWEWGPRLAKEMLFTGGRLGAQRLYAMGMVNRVVPAEQLREAALELAWRIADMPGSSLRQAKRAVNATMDLMGQHYVATRFADLLDYEQQQIHGREDG